jgi:hypothetical protein
MDPSTSWSPGIGSTFAPGHDERGIPWWERPVRVSGTLVVGFDGIRSPAVRVIPHPLGRRQTGGLG